MLTYTYTCRNTRISVYIKAEEYATTQINAEECGTTQIAIEEYDTTQTAVEECAFTSHRIRTGAVGHLLAFRTPLP